MIKLYAGASWLFMVGNSLLAAKPLGFRHDLAVAIDKILCNSKAIPKQEDFWKENIWDAGLHLRILDSKKAGKLTDSKLQIFASSQAKRSGHPSFSYGKCSSLKAWVISSPAPVASFQNASISTQIPNIPLPVEQLKIECKSWRVDFAPAHHGRGVRLTGSPQDPPKFLKLPKQPGIISLSCRPKQPSWAGPRLWYLFPRNLKISKMLPKLLPIIQEGLIADLSHWINQLRVSHQLSPLQFKNPALVQGARLLSLNGSLEHDRRLMKEVFHNLKKAGFEKSGEDRVRGMNASEISHLLWISPRHRNLLLQVNASHAGLHYDSDSGLLVLVISQKSAGPLAIKKLPAASKR